MTQAQQQPIPPMDPDVLSQLLANAVVSDDLDPCLHDFFEEAAELFRERLKESTAVPVVFTLKNVSFGSAASLLPDHDEGRSVVAQLHISDWETPFLVIADRTVAMSAVDLFLGGAGGAIPSTLERPLSSVEKKISRTLLARMTECFRAGLAETVDWAWDVGELIDEIDFKMFSGEDDRIVVAQYEFEACDAAGKILVVGAGTSFEPLQQVLTARNSGDAEQAPDPDWSKTIQNELNRGSVSLTAVLDQYVSPAGDIAQLKVGEVMRLNATPSSPVLVECNGESLMRCSFGQSNGVYTLRVEELLDPDRDFLGELAAEQAD